MGYVELHCHSAYSFLDGASQPEELAARAADLGYEALALTDHDGVYGSLEFAHAAKAFGLRPITGAEVTLEGGAHVTLLVETPKGYANLCRLLTEAHAGTRPKEGADPLPRSCRSSRCSRTPTASSACRAVHGTAWGRGIRTQPRASRQRSDGSASTSSSSARTSAATPAASPPCESSPATSGSPPSPPVTSTSTTSGVAPSRTPSSRSAAAPRSTVASRNGAATTRPSCSRPRRWSTASRRTATPCSARPRSPPAWPST